jgi:Trypsin
VITRVLVCSVAAALLAAAAPAIAAPAAEPRVIGGQPALGFPGVVAMAVFDGQRWNVCSAALVRPRVLMTAAHCLTGPGTNDSVVRVRVFGPGTRAVVYANTGPRRPAKVRVLKWWLGTTEGPRTATVQSNDIATVLLGGDLGPTPYARLATQAELARWRAQKVPVTHVGYGSAGSSRYSRIPRSVDLPLASLSLRGGFGATFSTGTTPTQSVCPGDSGSPAFVTDASSAVLVGTIAGSNGSCSPDVTTTPEDIGFVGVGYLDLLNAALAEGGYLTVPSAPPVSGLNARNRDVTVTWGPPTQSPATVTGYEVLDPAGAVVCQTDQLGCTLAGLPDGTYGYTVRSRNAEGQGDAVPVGASVVVASPPAPPAPTVRETSRRRYTITVTTIAGRTSAVVTSYVVRDQNGAIVCTLVPASATDSSLSCPGPTRRGTYTVSVHAETQMGPSPESPPSQRFTVR